MIPKVIHYCWFGGNPKPEIIESCIASWRKFCPDWEIIEWNENNFDVRRYTFMSEAYDAGKWAFVSDVARLMIIYEYGGIYLDTDVELRMSLEQVSRFNAFFAYDNLVNINTGIGFGAVPEHPYIQAMLESYADQHFDAHHVVACPKLNTDALRSCCPDWVVNGNETQCIDNSIFYSVSDFSAIAHHHGMQSWVDGPKFQSGVRARSKIGLRIQKWLQQPEKFAYIEKNFGSRTQKFYLFMAYDFFDYSILYFVKRLLFKFTPKNPH